MTLQADRLFATAVPVCPWADSITSLDLNLWNTLEMDLLPLAAAPSFAEAALPGVAPAKRAGAAKANAGSPSAAAAAASSAAAVFFF